MENESGWSKRDRLHSSAQTITYIVSSGLAFAKVPSHTTIESIIYSKDISNARTISYDAVTSYTTFYWDKPIAIPEGVTAYIGTLNDAQDVLTLSEISSGYIPACTSAVLVTEEKKGTSEEVTAADVDFAAIESDLKGILIAQTASEYVADGNAYVLSRKEDASSIGFYKFAGSTLAANKAYLVLPSASTAAPMVRMSFEDEVDNVSGIESVATEGTAPMRMFDLQGLRLSKAPLKGMYIMNGHKVIR